MPRPKILEAWRHGQGGRGRPQLCDGVSALRSRFAGEHAGKTHDGRFQCAGKRSLIFDILLPNPFG